MKLLTKEILKKLPPLYSNETKPANEVLVIVKFFNPCGSGTWYITEGDEVEGGDMMLFGLCVIHEAELGYVMLSELESVNLPFGLKIERDLHFGMKHTLAEVMKSEGVAA